MRSVSDIQYLAWDTAAKVIESHGGDPKWAVITERCRSSLFKGAVRQPQQVKSAVFRFIHGVDDEIIK